DPASCGRRFDQAWGRASRAARRLASACRICGSLCTASSKTPTRSLAEAAPASTSNTRAVKPRFIVFPLNSVSYVRSRCYLQLNARLPFRGPPGARGAAGADSNESLEREVRRPARIYEGVDDRLEQAFRRPGLL